MCSGTIGTLAESITEGVIPLQLNHRPRRTLARHSPIPPTFNAVADFRSVEMFNCFLVSRCLVATQCRKPHQSSRNSLWRMCRLPHRVRSRILTDRSQEALDVTWFWQRQVRIDYVPAFRLPLAVHSQHSSDYTNLVMSF